MRRARGRRGPRGRATCRRSSVVAETASAIDPFVKYLLAGARRRAVRGGAHPARASPAGSRSCVSSQVGCALACAFCATGRLGLARNLAAWEIVEQVRVVRARLPRRRASTASCSRAWASRSRTSTRCSQAIAVLTEPCALGIDARAITVCTAGLPSGIRRLAREAPQRAARRCRSSSAIAAHRKRVMPIAERHALDDVLAAAAEHARATGLAPMWAVTLLDGVNDGDADARALADRARAFHAATGVAAAALDHRLQRDRRRRSVRALAARGRVPRRARRRPACRRTGATRAAATSPRRAASSPTRRADNARAHASRSTTSSSPPTSPRTSRR